MFYILSFPSLSQDFINISWNISMFLNLCALCAACITKQYYIAPSFLSCHGQPELHLGVPLALMDIFSETLDGAYLTFN